MAGRLPKSFARCDQHHRQRHAAFRHPKQAASSATVPVQAPIREHERGTLVPKQSQQRGASVGQHVGDLRKEERTPLFTVQAVAEAAPHNFAYSATSSVPIPRWQEGERSWSEQMPSAPNTRNQSTIDQQGVRSCCPMENLQVEG